MFGPKFGFLRAVALGALLLAEFDYRTPVTTSDFSSPSGYETQSWDMQTQSVAGKYDNGVGSATLDNTGGLPDQTAPEVYGGGGYGTYNCWEADTTSDILTASDAGICQPVNVDFAVRVLVRHGNSATGNSQLAGNYTSKGWVLYESGAVIYFSLKDSTLKSVSFGAGSAAKLRDGAVHVVTVWYDHSAETAYGKIDNGAESSVATAAGEGDFSAGALDVGAGFTTVSTKQQALFVGYVEGANAQAYYDETVTLPGTDPATVTALTALTTISRISLISTELAPGVVGHFSGGTTPATCQMPLGFHPALEAGSGGIGLYCNSAVVNLVPYSRVSTGATGATTNVDNSDDAADGFRAATKSTATTANDYIGKTCVTVAATEYTESIYIKESTVGVQGRIYAYDLSNSAEIAGAITYTADGTWTRKQITFTTPSGCVSVSIRVEIDTDTESVLHDFWQLEAGDGAGAIINTSGSSAALVASAYKAVGSADVLAKSDQGEFEVVEVSKGTPGLYMLDITNGASVNDRRTLLYSSTVSDNIQVVTYNATGGVEAVLSDNIPRGTEDTVVCKWDALAALADGSNTSLKVDAEAVTNDTGTYTSGDALTTVTIGAADSAGGNLELNGFISRVRIWDGER